LSLRANANDPARIAPGMSAARRHWEDTMFEAPQDRAGGSKAGLWVGIAVVVVLVAAGVFWYMTSGGAKTAAPSGSAPAASASVANADPVKDIRVVGAKMDKDYTGTVARWSVDLRNTSQQFTYTNISYVTTYMGADNTQLAAGQGTLTISIGPGEEQTADFRDALYPSGTALYRFKITGAKASAQ
jgi:hypothetical protein